MSGSKSGLNNSALRLVNKLILEADRYGVTVEKTNSGATLIDAGFKAEGGFLAGEMVVKVCLGGYANVNVIPVQYGDLILPSVFVHTDHPVIATLASQFAGWRIEVGEFLAAGSGPARILALEPKDLFEKIKYVEESDSAVLVLETNSKPSEAVMQQIAAKCKVNLANLFIIYFSSLSLTGATQFSGRTLEVGLFKLMTLDLDPWLVNHAWGYAPIVPKFQSLDEAYERQNNAISCAGTVCCSVNYEDDEKLRNMVMVSSTSASKMFQEANSLAAKNPRYLEILKDAGLGFHKNDSTISPAVMIVNNWKTGRSFQAGSLDIEVLKMSLGIS